MTNRERFASTMKSEPVDRLPMIEWAGWWDKTIDRWRGEGLPDSPEDAEGIREYLGLDRYRQCWIGAKGPSFPTPEGHGKGVVSDMEDYLRVKEYLYPQDNFNRDMAEKWAQEQSRGDTVVWITLEGFFWFPRTLLGIEEHLYAFYDEPELMHTMNQDLVEYNLRALDRFCEICRPDFMTFAEDMSYNHGPMVSKSLFDEFLAPYYRRITPALKRHGIVSLVDSDGNIENMASWFLDVGIEGFLPLERQSGVDIARLRGNSPRIKMIGGYDKMVMNKGEAAMRAEFERILPVMRQGGYIPSVDHQTPPGVSLQDYHIYLKLLEEYCFRAVR